MAKLKETDVVLPSIYNSDGYQKYINTNYPSSDSASVEDVVKSYMDFLSVDYKKDSAEYELLNKAISVLPSNFMKIGLLNNIDMRPLLEAVGKTNFKWSVIFLNNCEH